MALSARPEDVETWREIRDVAFQVVLVTRRRGGLWALPVNEDDRYSYARPGSDEDIDREEAPFGFSSITVSCNALMGLTAAATGLPAWLADETLQKIDKGRHPRGGYGSPRGGRDGGVKADPIARHTAMAAVSHLLFSVNASPAELSHHLAPTIGWLLSNARIRGGWYYDRESRNELGYLSTAAAICAMALYLRLGEAPKAMAARIGAQLSKSYDALMAAQTGGVWDGDHVPPRFQTRDAAFALSLLLIAQRRGALSQHISPGSKSIGQAVEDFSLTLRHGGWGSRAEDDVPNAPATIAALQLVSESGMDEHLDSDAIQSAMQCVLDAWRSRALYAQMTAWDWQCAVMLAPSLANVGKMPAARSSGYVQLAQHVRQRMLARTLVEADLGRLHPRAREVLIYPLTEGAGFPRPVEAWLRSLPAKFGEDIRVYVSSVIITAIVALIVYLIGREDWPRQWWASLFG